MGQAHDISNTRLDVYMHVWLCEPDSSNSLMHIYTSYMIHVCIYRYGSVTVRHGIISSICTCSWPMHHACTYRFRVEIVRSHDQMVELLYYTASFTVTSTTSWVSCYKWRIETSYQNWVKCPLYIWSWTAMVVEMFAASLLFAIACWWATQWVRSVS